MKKKKLKKSLSRLTDPEATEFQHLALMGFQAVINGENSLEEWLLDIEPVAKKYRCRLVVVMWPKSAPLPFDTSLQTDEAPNLDGWLCDFDFCFDQPPYTVSIRRQPSAPEWMSKPENLIFEKSGIPELERLEQEATEPRQFLSAEIGRDFEAYQQHGDWERFLCLADAACEKFSGSAVLLFTPDRKTISMLVEVLPLGTISSSPILDAPDKGYIRIKTFVCDSDEEFHAAVAIMEGKSKPL